MTPEEEQQFEDLQQSLTQAHDRIESIQSELDEAREHIRALESQAPPSNDDKEGGGGSSNSDKARIKELEAQLKNTLTPDKTAAEIEKRLDQMRLTGGRGVSAGGTWRTGFYCNLT
jgi:predicted  nucleic acid-binding Zn-ribbon protein